MLSIRTSVQQEFSSRRDPDAVKAAGWHEVGILAISLEDDRLNDFERQFLNNLGEKFYGERGSEPRERGSSPIKQRKGE